MMKPLFDLFRPWDRPKWLNVFLWCRGSPSPVNLVESPLHLRFRIKSGILHYTTRCDTVLGSSYIGSPDKDEFSTSGRSGNHTDKRMDPWHEMTGIVFIGDVKYVRIVGLCHVIRFYFITLWALLLLLLLWGKRVWLLLLWGKRVWLLLLLLLLWSKRVWLLLLKCRLLLTVFAF